MSSEHDMAGNVEAAVSQSLLTRRQAGMVVSAAAIVGVASPAAALVGEPVSASARAIATTTGPDGSTFMRPAKGRAPALAMWAKPGAASREAARRLAMQGWAVLLADDTKLGSEKAIRLNASAMMEWLEQQEGVQPAGKRSGGSLGRGYTLRSVSAARPRFSLATRAQRREASASAILVACADASFSQAARSELGEAAHLIHRLG